MGKRNAEGIALIDDSHDKMRLRYVFDVSDTNSYYGNRPYIWKPEPRDTEPIMEALSNSFGEQEAPDLPAALMKTAMCSSSIAPADTTMW